MALLLSFLVFLFHVFLLVGYALSRGVGFHMFFFWMLLGFFFFFCLSCLFLVFLSYLLCSSFSHVISLVLVCLGGVGVFMCYFCWGLGGGVGGFWGLGGFGASSYLVFLLCPFFFFLVSFSSLVLFLVPFFPSCWFWVGKKTDRNRSNTLKDRDKEEQEEEEEEEEEEETQRSPNRHEAQKALPKPHEPFTPQQRQY